MKFLILVLGVITMFASIWGNTWLFVQFPEYQFAGVMSGILGVFIGWGICAYAIFEGFK